MKKSRKRKSRCSSAPGNPDRSSHGRASPLRIQASQSGPRPSNSGRTARGGSAPAWPRVSVYVTERRLRGRAPKLLAGARDR